MAGVMAGGAGAGDQKVGFWYYGPTVVNMPESHNRTLVGTVSTHFSLADFCRIHFQFVWQP